MLASLGPVREAASVPNYVNGVLVSFVCCCAKLRSPLNLYRQQQRRRVGVRQNLLPASDYNSIATCLSSVLVQCNNTHTFHVEILENTKSWIGILAQQRGNVVFATRMTPVQLPK